MQTLWTRKYLNYEHVLTVLCTLTRSSSSEEFTQGCMSRNWSFWSSMASFWEFSRGCSSALKTVAPMMRYSTTRKKMADTVFHLMTVVRVSHSASGVFRTTGFAENDRRGLELWAAALGSSRSGAATAKTDVINIFLIFISVWVCQSDYPHIKAIMKRNHCIFLPKKHDLNN